MMQNNCQYVSIWFGMGKIGVSTALLNTNIVGNALIHSVEVALKDSVKKVLIVDSELAAALATDLATLRGKGVSVYFWDDLQDPVGGAVGTALSERPAKKSRNLILENEPLLFVFTSGTTGLPKAARISSTRLFMMTLPARYMGYLKEGRSILYCCLPLYHSAGGLLGAGSALLSGCTLVIRKKFSASHFTSDLLRYKVNSVQYIGELCGYLMLAPPNPDDSKLDIHYAFGNGMRKEVWTPFCKRYNVRRVVEFYSATESNVGLFNSTGQVGALGVMPRFLDFIYPVIIIRVDPENRDTPYRTAEGRCVLADINETGLVCSKIGKSSINRFDGYSDKTATGQKVLTDVFVPGDSYFNTGDLLRRDAFGLFYWSDRVGDTFRWKGENVATTEVEHVLNVLPFVSDLCVYGVEVPNYGGRCGMVAMALSGLDKKPVDELLKKVDWSLYHKECTANLPVYARPPFIRVAAEALQTTGTFKHQKNVLVKAGFNPTVDEGTPSCDDRLFFYSSKDGSVVPLDAALYDRILSGKCRL
jgi:fatty-acyl-CoA synthase